MIMLSFRNTPLDVTLIQYIYAYLKYHAQT